jgi:hypothetical protein
MRDTRSKALTSNSFFAQPEPRQTSARHTPVSLLRAYRPLYRGMLAWIHSLKANLKNRLIQAVKGTEFVASIHRRVEPRESVARRVFRYNYQEIALILEETQLFTRGGGSKPTSSPKKCIRLRTATAPH